MLIITETYYEDAPYASFMSIPLYRQPNPPNVALQPDITPGKCWAFKGSKGYMMIKVLTDHLLICIEKLNNAPINFRNFNF